MTSVADETKVADIPRVIRIDEKELRGHVDRVVRDSVEETLNAMLDAEADTLCGAERYERSPERVDTRAGTCSVCATPRSRRRSSSVTAAASRAWKRR